MNGIEKQKVVYENGTKLLVCMSCGKEFAFPPKEQRFFEEKGFRSPIRCRPCRADHREKRERDQQHEQGKTTLGDAA
jgi:DNA-directed RNA polymerase subunit RPC12/RpoP